MQTVRQMIEAFELDKFRYTRHKFMVQGLTYETASLAARKICDNTYNPRHVPVVVYDVFIGTCVVMIMALGRTHLEPFTIYFDDNVVFTFTDNHYMKMMED